MIKKLILSVFNQTQNDIKNSSVIDYKTILICVTVAFSLSVIKYFGDVNFTLSVLHSWGLNDLSDKLENLTSFSSDAKLYRLLYWSLVVTVFYLFPPFVLIKFVFKQKLSDYGLQFKGALKEYKVYVLMLCVMIPLVLYFARTQSFQNRYPFYNLGEQEKFYPNLFIWELFYLIQFFALEFFFRGFMLHGTKQTFGFYSIFVMTIPYCMIHFGKPFPETIAAIVAGIVLGFLSLKSRSIWLGVLIHYSVAITMDICSLYHKGLL
jgi:membrane protease YdiL (CAAX protease family)